MIRVIRRRIIPWLRRDLNEFGGFFVDTDNNLKRSLTKISINLLKIIIERLKVNLHE